MEVSDVERRDALNSMIAALGISAEEAAALILSSAGLSEVPSIAEYLPVVEGATSSSAARTYSTYWRKLKEGYGDYEVTDVRTSDLETLLNNMSRVERKNGRGGYQARRSAVQAWRKVFSCAERDGLIRAGDNPASKLQMPRRKPVSRRGLSPDEVTKLFDFVSSTGNDPELDSLLVRFHLETGARRGGATSLVLSSLDDHRQTVTLLEKGVVERELPVTPELMSGIRAMGRSRSANHQAAFRYLNGKPLTRRRYNYLFERVQGDPPFPAADAVSAHWLRHTIVTWMERAGGEAVAAQFAGHAPFRSPVTGLYTTAPTTEVIRTWCAVWNVDHPLSGE